MPIEVKHEKRTNVHNKKMIAQPGLRTQAKFNVSY